MIVTAGKREQDLQDVSSSVTAFTAALREETGIISAQDQLNFTPGVSYAPGADRIVIRGIGRVTQQLGTDAGVAVYQDGFYVGSAAYLPTSTLQNERVEVLRGPQGTLYGRNSIGGAINAVSRRPTDDFAFDARASINSYGGLRGETRVAGELRPGLNGSLLIGGVTQDDGYYKNKAGGLDEGGPEHSWNVDAQLAWQPNDKVDLWLRYNTQDSTTNPRSSVGISPYINTRGTGVPNVFYGLDPMSNPGITDHRAFRADRRTTATLKDYNMVIGEATYHADSFDVKYLAGFRTYDYWLYQDGNATDNKDFLFPRDCGILLGGPVNTDCDLTQPGVQESLVLVHNDTIRNSSDIRTEYSHELNITSTGNGPLQYILGAYYFRSNQEQNFLIANVDEVGNQVITVPGSAPPNTNSTVYAYNSFLTTISTAVFGQIDYEITPEWKLTAGLRYSNDKKKGYEDNIFVYWLPAAIPAGVDLDGPGPLPPLAAPYVSDIVGGTCSSAEPTTPPLQPIDPAYSCPVYRRTADSWNAVTGTAGLQWTPSDDRMVYARYSRGYKSGGFNLGTILSKFEVKEETVDAYELGWKERLNDTLQFNTAAFYYKYHNQQSQVGEVQGDIQQVQVSYLINLPEVETYGFELEATWNPIDNLRFLVNYSYLHTEIQEGCCYSDTSDFLALQPGAKPVPGQEVYKPGLPQTPDNIAERKQTLVGNQLAGAPPHKVAVNGTYTWNLGRTTLTASATWNWRDDSYYTLFNNPLHLVKGGDTTDLRVSWNDPETGVTVIGSVENLFDQEVATGFFTDTESNLRYQSLFLEPPRIVTLEVQYKF